MISDLMRNMQLGVTSDICYSDQCVRGNFKIIFTETKRIVLKTMRFNYIMFAFNEDKNDVIENIYY